MQAENFFNEAQKQQIKDAIIEAEKNTSGEIRVHVENRCKEDVLDKATYWFKQLKMHKTELRNGVLFYLAIHDKKFAILGDAGINAVTPDNFWDEIKTLVLDKFKSEAYTEGLSEGILKAGQALKEHFPYQKDDVNELSDDISFGKK